MAVAQPTQGNPVLESPAFLRPRTLTGVRGLRAWGLLNVALTFVPSILPSFWGLGQFNKFVIMSIALWLMFAWRQLQVPIRIVFPVVTILALQLWLTFCSLHAQFTLARVFELSHVDYFLFTYMMVFLQASALVYYWPDDRKRIINGFIIMVFVSSVVAWAQFIKFPPALALSRVYSESRIDDWGGRGGVRAFGLFGQMYLSAIFSLTCVGLIASRLLTRSLNRIEFALVLFFFGSALIAQYRSLYPSIAITMAIFIGLLLYRERAKAVLYLGLMVAGIVVLFAVSGSRFDYLLSTKDFRTDETLVFRMEYAWTQANRIWETRPWTGIGPDLSLVGGGGEAAGGLSTRWLAGYNLDNGYLMFLCFGGIPAVAMWALVLASSLTMSYRLLLNRIVAPERRYLAAGVFINAICVTITMLMTNVVQAVNPNMAVYTLAGLAMTAYAEDVRTLKSRYHRSLKR